MNAPAILEFFRNRESSILSSIREIVDIESPSFDVEGSKRIAAWIENQIRNVPLDLQVERIDAEDVGQHVVIRAFASDRPPVLLLGHTDTVHPVGTTAKNPTRIENDKFYGCGIFDMKANVVLMIEMLGYFAETARRPAQPVTILLSCDEEVGSFTGRPVVEREAVVASKCFVLEPSLDGMVKTGRKGTGMFTIRTHGIPAHAGLEPEKGASAILELARQIDKINELNDAGSGTSANVCTIKGGTTSNVIPDLAEASIDVRFTKFSDAVRIENAIRGLQPVDQRVRIEITGSINRPPMERTDSVAKLFETARGLAREIGYELGEVSVGGASDGNFVAALGVPVLDGLGIAGDGAHTLNEHILVSDIAKRATLLTLMLTD